MYVGTSGSVYVEKAHPAYPLVINFLVSCCEPVSRTHHVEHYRLDQASLSAASAEGTYTTDMIRNVLRYFRLNEQGLLPIDLAAYRQLEQWAASPQAETDPQSYRDLRLPTSLASRGTTTTGANAPSRTLSTSDDALPVRPVKVLKLETGAEAAVATTAATAAMAADAKTRSDGPVKKEPGVARRLLSLGGAARGAGSVPQRMSSPTTRQGAREGTANETRVPLLALALTSFRALQPLPAAIERMLREEEEASKMLIVLQPRLRRFHDMPSSAAGKATANTSNSNNNDAAREDTAELFYFLVSRDRGHLERVMEGVKEFIEPVLLHGTPRWVISDVDRNAFRASHSPAPTRATTVQEHYGSTTTTTSGGSSSSPAVLRRLFASEYVMCGSSEGAQEEDEELENSGGAGNMLRPAGGQGYAASGTPGTRVVFKSQIKPGKLRNVKERLFRVYGIRADCFYEYTQDPSMHVEQLSLASCVRLRHYQTASLERFRQGEKAHQGVVVLPCGAGKTLTGIGAAATLRKRTMVLCVNNLSVFQWRREFLRWTNLPPGEVTICTVHEKQMPGSVFITTYSMLIAKRPRRELAGRAAQESGAILDAVGAAAWGLLILDEVHTALAHHFQEVLNKVRYKCVLGLSATLLREDDKIADLRHLVGPKLYEANWLELTRQGYLARVECAEVQCPLPLSLFNAYVTAARRGSQGLSAAPCAAPGRRATRGIDLASQHIASCNPYKLWCTQALLEFHRQRSPPDKVIIFCDYLADVRYYAHHLHLPFMDQRTSEAERANLLQYFQFSSTVNAIILTRVGDVALDLPCASVIIQISGLGASRRQEAQRLGRILRPKPPSLDNTCSYFYTLVSQDTHEIRTSYERQSWLRDQGFGYRVLHCGRVLEEFRRVGGQPCCIGPPQWWYQAHVSGGTKDGKAISHVPPDPRWRRAGDARSAAHRANSKEDNGDGDGDDETYWAPFSSAASALLQQSFQRGKDGCTLSPAALGEDTVRPSTEELRAWSIELSPEESWVVRFSSADAPATFGVVTIGTSEHPRMVRRVRWGTLDAAHDCLSAGVGAPRQPSCLAYATREICGGGGEYSGSASHAPQSPHEGKEEEEEESAYAQAMARGLLHKDEDEDEEGDDEEDDDDYDYDGDDDYLMD